jgi:hypothetical protein
VYIPTFNFSHAVTDNEKRKNWLGWSVTCMCIVYPFSMSKSKALCKPTIAELQLVVSVHVLNTVLYVDKVMTKVYIALQVGSKKEWSFSSKKQKKQ